MGFKPKKGDAPPTGRVRPSSNFERTMALASQIAAESVPDEHTVSANEQAPAVVSRGVLESERDSGLGTRDSGGTSPESAPSPESRVPSPDSPVPDPESAVPTSASPRLASMPIAEVRPSPFQPKGRPSQGAVNAVARAIERTGSIDALVGAEGHTTFQALSAEAKRLAELAYSVSRDGVRDPIEVRVAEDGAVEALSGHRRMAAALLVGHTEIPVLQRGPMSAVQAAATVLSGNLHREDFTPWQEAVLVTEVVAQRRADGLPADVRTIGAIMGYSHGRVSTLQTIRRVLSDEFLTRLGDRVTVEEALARFGNYSRLEEVARLPDDTRREVILRRLLGMVEPSSAAAAEPETPAAFEHRPKRRGGFTIEVHRAIEELAPSDAMALRELLATQVARLDARLGSAGRG
ncbi:ParB domain protein nuclease (plasmid) [Gemmatirosa kalamazoonensis]|uniref:ParB domain protein nuclease n=1 Tax=Gemmatirosa kalamazoonensis TaxID=861299 RepID=W0RVJ6_9BACT|nr:ParB N-terminal domain-containing protein [Gemmatirosa kalamazoonensis]AHG93608.1 ParB domain protein nuclease [Gemmatirosa kalamazoonensis]